MSQGPQNPFDPNDQKDKPGSRGRGVSTFTLLVGVIALTGLGVFFLADRFPGALSSDGDQIDLVRLLAILLMVMASVVGMKRINFSALPKLLRDIGLWVVIFIVIFLGYSYRDAFEDLGDRILSALIPGQAMTTDTGDMLFSRSSDGHFYIEAFADNERIKFLVDTGASSIVLSPRDATRLGYDFNNLNFNQIFETANGTGRGAKARLYSLVVGERSFKDITVSVNQADMSTSLLGMSFLQQFESFEFKGDKLILRSR